MSSLATTTTDGGDDSSVGSLDSSMASSANKRAAKQIKSSNKVIKKTKFQTTTTLYFIYSDGTRTTKELAFRVTSYSELQREIARLFPSSQRMFVIQDIEGKKIFPENFIPATKMFVREVLTRPPNLQELRMLPIKWETEDYHDIRYKNLKQSEESRMMMG